MAATVGDIFDVLISGKKVQLSFETEGQFFSFRSKIYAYKKDNEQALIDLELLNGPKSLSVTCTDTEQCTYTFQLVEKISRQSTYDFVILED